MIAELLLLSTLSFAPPLGETPVPCVARPPADPVGDTLRELYASGQTFEVFMAEATRRKALWDGNYEAGEELDPDLVARARAVPGTWRFLAVAVDSCSDSVNTIPYLARLAERVEGIDLRIVDADAGRDVMESHRTADGRAATPTVLLLDDDWQEAGCFIERPSALKAEITALGDGASRNQVYDFKMGWYDEDGGRHTIEQFVTMLEAAAAGEARCG